VPAVFGVGFAEETLVNPTGTAVDYATGGTMPRTLVTEIRYPTVAGSGTGAPPARGDGPFPLIVFAHGYAVTPDNYDTLLDAWVRAGFVVVAPLFPDENGREVAALGGPDSYAGSRAENDLYEEPSDLAYLVNEISVQAAHPAPAGGSVLYHLVDPSRLVLAGQSDGADAVAALVYDSAYAGDLDSMAHQPRVVGVFSGAEMGPSSNYRVPAPAPLLVVVQSAADECNFPQLSTQLYDNLGEGSGKWFLETLNSTHLGPYATDSAAGQVVQATTVKLFDLAVGRKAPDPAAIVEVVLRSGVARLTGGPTAPAIRPFYPQSQAQVAAACALP
jgi:dienelactone hydrolase